MRLYSTGFTERSAEAYLFYLLIYPLQMSFEYLNADIYLLH